MPFFENQDFVVVYYDAFYCWNNPHRIRKDRRDLKIDGIEWDGYSMTVIAIVGSLWVDEGKGRQTAIYARDADIGARGSGSHNAGHKFTVSGTTYNFHIVPSTLVYNKPSVIGNGVVLNPPVFFDEVDSLQKTGLNTENIY